LAKLKEESFIAWAGILFALKRGVFKASQFIMRQGNPMARIYEYQAKQLLKKVGVNVPAGDTAATPDEAAAVATRIAKPVAVKAQVWAAGRLQAGGIRFAKVPEEAFQHAQTILGMRIKGLPVRKVLVEERLDTREEYYAGVVVDGSMRVKAPVLIFSTEGGTGIEEVAARSPQKVVKHVIDPLSGLDSSQVDVLLGKLAIETEVAGKLNEAICGLYRLFREYDARNAEINPLVLTKEGEVFAVDCHVNIDDNSVFRHRDFGIRVPRDMDREPTELEKLAWDNIEEGDFRGTGYFAQMVTDFQPGETYVGFHGIGGGGSMLGAAALINRGMRIANYADTSGDPPASKIYKVIRAIFSQPISAYVLTGACLANQEQWYHAFAIVKALKEELRHRPGFPVIILLAGNKEAEAMGILREGLKGIDIRLELYGREHIYNSDYIGERAETLIAEYLREARGTVSSYEKRWDQ
jgi:succinyl-CoA synthetase beta subunit